MYRLFFIFIITILNLNHNLRAMESLKEEKTHLGKLPMDLLQELLKFNMPKKASVQENVRILKHFASLLKTDTQFKSLLLDPDHLVNILLFAYKNDYIHPVDLALELGSAEAAQALNIIATRYASIKEQLFKRLRKASLSGNVQELVFLISIIEQWPNNFSKEYIQQAFEDAETKGILDQVKQALTKKNK